MKPFIFIVSALLLMPGVTLAQQPQPTPPADVASAPAPGGLSVSGVISPGVQQTDNDTGSSKFTEYRDLRDDAYLPALKLSLFDPAKSLYLDFSGSNISRDDQTIAFRTGRPGSWNVRFDWNDIPHNFSNKAFTPYIRRTPGVFEVPATIPITFKKLATAAPDTAGVVDSDRLIAAYQATYLGPTPLATQNGFGRLGAEYAGAGPLKLAFAYDIQRKDGLKATYGPIGDRPPRSLNIQLTEPVDHTTQDLTVSGERVGRNYQVQFNYLFSNFANNVDTLVWQNVYTTAAPGATSDVWDRAVSTFGRRPLAPDNQYHNASVSVGRDLARDSRLSATLAFARLEQNQELLPYSYNSDLLAVSALPRGTADARINTTQVLVDYVVNPAAGLNVRAWARYYGMDNNTPESRFQYVTSDTPNLNGTVSFKNKRVSLAYASDRNTAGVEANYRVRPLHGTVGVGYEREGVTRDYREADTTENRLIATLRTRPVRWANLRARYTFGARDGDGYDAFVTRQSYWYAPAEAGTDADNPGFAFSNHPDMRRFDVSDRRRNQFDLTLNLTPEGPVSVAASVRYRNDDFESDVAPIQPLAGTSLPEAAATTPGVQLGWINDKQLRYGLDAFYLASDRVSFNAFVSLDKGTSFERSLEFNENNKQNPSTVATAELGPWTRGSSTWTTDHDDRNWNYGVGGTFGLVPERLVLSAIYSASRGDLDITYSGYGVTNWDGTPYPANHQFGFSTPPRINNDLHLVDVRLEIPVTRAVQFLVGYSFERFETDDWQQSTEQPWFETVGSEFLLRDTSRSFQWGNRLFNLGSFLAPSYDAHIGYAAFTYRF